MKIKIKRDSGLLSKHWKNISYQLKIEDHPFPAYCE